MFIPTLVLLMLADPPAPPARPPGLAPDLAPPVHVLVGGKPLDVERSGHAAPFVGDFFGDGKPALLVGQYDGGSPNKRGTWMRRALTIACFFLSSATLAQPGADDVNLKIVKYDGLKDVILQNRGKVIFVDFWADF